MTVDIYSGKDTYVVYKEDTAWGTDGDPAGTDFVDRVISINTTVNNNRMRFNTLGTGANADTVINGVVEVTGSVTSYLTNADFWQYLINGVKVANTGNQGDPSDINEADLFGYNAPDCPSVTIEFGNNATVDDVITVSSCLFTGWRLTARVGEPVVWSADFRARTVTRTASAALTYTAPTEEPFTFADGSLVVGSDTVLRLESFELSGTNGQNFYYALGSRLLQQPTMGVRRYDFVITVRHSDETTGSKLSGTEIRELFFGAAASTTPETGGIPTQCGDIYLSLTEGTTAGDETFKFQLDDCYLNEISEPIEMSDEGGAIMFTVTGFALTAKTNGANKTFLEYYTYA